MDKADFQSYVRAWYVLFFCGILGFLMVKYTGTGKEMISPMTAFTAIFTALAVKLLDFFTGESKSKFRILELSQEVAKLKTENELLREGK